MKENIIITYTSKREEKFIGGTLEFLGILGLFECLTEEDIPSMDVPEQKAKLSKILQRVVDFNIKAIEFTNFRKVHFFSVDLGNEKFGFDIKIEEKTQSLDKMLEAVSNRKDVKIMGGTLDDFKEMGGNIPEPLKEIIRDIEDSLEKKRQEKKADSHQTDPRQTHNTADTTH